MNPSSLPSVGNHHRHITERFQDFQKGKFSPEDKNIVVILFNTMALLAHRDLPDIVDIWNDTYPEDPMDEVFPAQLAMTAIDFTKDFNPHDPTMVEQIINNLIDIQLFDLAYVIKGLLVSSGQV